MSSAVATNQTQKPQQKTLLSFFGKATSTAASSSSSSSAVNDKPISKPSAAAESSSSSSKQPAASAADKAPQRGSAKPATKKRASTAAADGEKKVRKPRKSAKTASAADAKTAAQCATSAATATATAKSLLLIGEREESALPSPSAAHQPSPNNVADLANSAECSRDSAASEVFPLVVDESDLCLSESDAEREEEDESEAHFERLVSSLPHTPQKPLLVVVPPQSDVLSLPLAFSPPARERESEKVVVTTAATVAVVATAADLDALPASALPLLLGECCELSSFYVSPAATNLSCALSQSSARATATQPALSTNTAKSLSAALREVRERHPSTPPRSATTREKEARREFSPPPRTPVKARERETEKEIVSERESDKDTEKERESEMVDLTQSSVLSLSPSPTEPAERVEESTETASAAVVVDLAADAAAPLSSRIGRKIKPRNAFDPTPVSMRCVKSSKNGGAAVSPSLSASEAAAATVCVSLVDDELGGEREKEKERDGDEAFDAEKEKERETKTPRAKRAKTAKEPREKEKEREISPEQRARLDKLNERAAQLVRDLMALEKCDDLQDNRLELDDLAAQCHAFLSVSPSASEGETESAAQTETERESALATRCREFSHAVVARCVQGSALPLSALTQELSVVLTDLRSALLRERESEKESERQREAQRVAMLSQLDMLLSCEGALSEEVKLLAQREAHGVRPTQCGSAFDDETLNAMWRWEVFLAATLRCERETSLAALRDAKAMRAKYSRALRVLAQIMTHTLTHSDSATQPALTTPTPTTTQTTAATESEGGESSLPLTSLKQPAVPAPSTAAAAASANNKLAILEEKLGKSIAEIEKAKEKRRKERETQQRKREKESAKDREREASEREKDEKERALSEKTERERERLRKQQNSMKSFFTQPALSTSVAAVSGSGAVLCEAQRGGAASIVSVASVGVSGDTSLTPITQRARTTPVSACPSPSVKVPAPLNVDSEREREKDKERDAFLDALSTHASWTEILTQRHRERESRRAAASQLDLTRSFRRPSRTVSLSVTVTATSKEREGAVVWGEREGECECVSRRVSRRVKTLRFHEDVRPAYVGTHSQRSLTISGRAPLAKDTALCDYEYDSEAEWDEEDEDGEDLLGSEDELDEDEENENAKHGQSRERGGEELEYDEMFLRDDDFGSDVDEDGEELCVWTHGAARCKEELFGPRFLVGESRCMREWRERESERERAACDSLSSSPSQHSHTTAPPRGVLTLFADPLYASVVRGSLSSYQGAESESDEDEARRLASFPTAVFAPSLLRLSSALSVSLSAGEKEKEGGASVRKKQRKTSEKEGEKEKNDDAEQGHKESVSERATSSGKGFDETKIADLLRLIHGKKDSVDKLVALFQTDCPHMAKAAIKRRIAEAAEKTKHAAGHGSARFIVKKELLEKHCPELAQEEVAFTPTPSRKKKRVSSEDDGENKKKQTRLSLTQEVVVAAEDSEKDSEKEKESQNDDEQPQQDISSSPIELSYFPEMSR